MFLKRILITLLSVLFVNNLFSQVADTTEAIDEDNGEMYTNIEISFSEDQGNTNFRSLYYGFDYTLIGDAGPIKDTELFFAFNRSDDKIDNDPFSDDQTLTLKFDILANQRISPFLFFQKTFDKTIGLQNRQDIGFGAKVGVFKGFSLSYAFLAENEEYTSYSTKLYTDSSVVTDPYYEDYDVVYPTIGSDTDSTYFSYIDSTEIQGGGKNSFMRHSLRPKIKYKFLDGNVIFDYRFYYKPKVDDFEDYLLEHELKISMVTFYEALSVNLNYTNKYNKFYDLETPVINPDTGKPYSDTDINVSIGFSFMF